MRYVWSVIIFMCLHFPDTSHASGVLCRHFWVKQLQSDVKGFVPSGNVVGSDPGDSPYGTDGVYKCEIIMSESLEIKDRYLYIGEVGDASNLIFDEIPNSKLTVAPVLHGLDPAGKMQPQDLRSFPFFLPVSYFFNGSGTYRFTVNYRNLIQGQSGIRSGKPVILTGKQLLFRSLHDYQSELFYLLEALIALGLLPLLVFALKDSFLETSLLALITLLTSVLFFSFSSLPRTLMDPLVAVKLHDFLILIVTLIGNYALLLFFKKRGQPLGTFVFQIHLLVSIFLFILLLKTDLSLGTQLRIQGFALFWTGSILPLIIYLGMEKGLLACRVSPNLRNRAAKNILLLKALIMIWDGGNLALFDGRFVFFSGKIYFGVAIGLICFFKIRYTLSEIAFRRDISAIRTEILRVLSSSSVEDSLVLSQFASHVGKICYSLRVSISEILPENKMRLVGKFGQYENAGVPLNLVEKSLSYAAAKTLEVQYRMLPLANDPTNSAGGLSDCVVIPLRNSEDLPGILSLTNFYMGIFPPFIAERLQILQGECEVLFNLMKSKRDSRAKARLVQATRLKIHPLQMESEAYFLENFEISQNFVEPAFIFGDVVDSVTINEEFGGENLKRVIDAQLGLIFKENRDLGIILSRDRGDSVSFIIPNQSGDQSTNDAAERGFRLLGSIRQLSGQWQLLGKSMGIPIPLTYRFVLSAGGMSLQPPRDSVGKLGITSFSLLTDAAIDEASRIVSQVCAPGEYLLTEGIVKKLTNANSFILELPPTRLKGKSMSTRIYCLSKNFKKKSA